MERVLPAACLLAGFSAACICLDCCIGGIDSRWRRCVLRGLGVAACGLLVVDAFSGGGLIERTLCLSTLETELAEAYGIVGEDVVATGCLWGDDCILVKEGGSHSFACREGSEVVDTMVLASALLNVAVLTRLLL